MDLQMLRAVQKAVPILLRHFDGYIDLAEQDWAAAKKLTRNRLQAWAVGVLGILFTVLAIFIFVIAAAWDTEYRLLVIGAMGGIFAATTIGAAIYLRRNRNKDAFAGVRREWRRDRAIVHRLLDDSQDSPATR